jgi:hypothetical protein
MPTISVFYGVVIRMFWADHAPPHFHAMYGNEEAVIAIQTLQLVRGGLPRTALRLTLEWAVLHRHELLENWTLCETKQTLKNIPPLE